MELFVNAVKLVTSAIGLIKKVNFTFSMAINTPAHT